MTRQPPAHDPVQDTPGITPPRRSAAGLPAVAESLRTATAQMGVRRTALTLLRVNQNDGFDCPGCAWPEPDKPHTAEFCENGAKAVAEEATLRRVTPAFFAEHPVADLANRSGYWLGQQGRLTQPMYLAEGARAYEPVSWERAFDIVAEELTALESPDEAVFYTSGRTSNEAAFLYQLFAREYGTNNLPDCSNMCHESSGSALGETLGVGKGSVHLEDLHQAELIIVAGQNPGTNHPRMLSALEKAKAGGAKIITVNPLPEAGLNRFHNPQTARGLTGRGTQLTDLFLQIRLGGDQALFRMLAKLVLEADGIDEGFIAEHTQGFEEFATAARAADWDTTLEATGLDHAEIGQAARLVLASKRTIVCWAMGLTQHKHAVPTIKDVVNLLLLRGDIGRPGSGVCPVRGHSNVQGDRTMGIFERPPAALLDALRDEFGFEPPREHGLDVVRAIRALRDGDAKVFFAMGGNFVAATPDTAVTEDAMRRARLTVHVSTKLNRSHCVTGARALILPTLGRTERDRQAGGEQFVTVEDSMGMVHASRGRLTPASPKLLSEPAIIARLAHRVLGDGSRVPWTDLAADYSRVRDRIARVIPGFHDFNDRVARPGGFALPHAPRDERRFPTATGKAHFTAEPVTWPRVPEGRLLLQTLRSHDQYNTTIYGLDDRYRGIKNGRRVVLVHPDDATAAGLPDGSYADLTSEWTRRQRTHRPRLPRRALPHRPRLRRRLLPRGQRPPAARPHRRHLGHPRGQIHRHPPQSRRRRLSTAKPATAAASTTAAAANAPDSHHRANGPATAPRANPADLGARPAAKTRAHSRGGTSRYRTEQHPPPCTAVDGPVIGTTTARRSRTATADGTHTNGAGTGMGEHTTTQFPQRSSTSGTGSASTSRTSSPPDTSANAWVCTSCAPHPRRSSAPSRSRATPSPTASSTAAPPPSSPKPSAPSAPCCTAAPTRSPSASTSTALTTAASAPASSPEPPRPSTAAAPPPPTRPSSPTKPANASAPPA